MTRHHMTNPHGLPLPSPTAPMRRDHRPGEAFEHIPADLWTSKECLALAIGGEYFSNDHFYTMSEYRNWEGVMRGDVTILGRVHLNDNFLDLVVRSVAGHLWASSISLREIKLLHPDIQRFLNQQFDAPKILTRENPWSMFPNPK